MKRMKAFLVTLLSVLCMLAATFGFVACGEKQNGTVKLAFNENLKETYTVGEFVDLEEAIDLPEFKSYSMKAEYELDGKKKTYLCLGLSFKPMNVGEVTVTVTCGEEKISTDLRIVEIAPSVGIVDHPEYQIGAKVTREDLEGCVNVLPLGTPVSIESVRYAGGEKVAFMGDEYTFENIGEYEFYYSAENSSGKVEGSFSVTVTREQTAVEKVDLSNSIKQMDYATVEQTDEHSEDSDWAWKVSADPTGMYAGGGNFSYWLSRVYFDFGRVIDLSEEYIEMDVWASENTYEGGVLIYYAPSYPMQLEWHVCPGTVYNQWTTVSTAQTAIRESEDKTSTGVRGIIVSVLHRQVGEYNPNEVYMLFDNLRVLKYPVLGENEVDDATNNGANGLSQGVSFRRYVDKNTGEAIDKAAESDWAYRISTKSESKASDYPYADVYFTTTSQNYSLHDYAFSFFVKGNASYYHEQFLFSVLYLDEKGVLQTNGSWQYKAVITEGSWNYISSVNIGLKSGQVAGIRFWLNTATTSVTDAELYVDNLRIYPASEAENADLSNRISVPARGAVSYAMSTAQTSGESAWAWRLTGEHFDYVTVNFGAQYAFSNYVLSMDIKPIANFGGMVVLQFIAADGSVKKDVVVREGDEGYTQGEDGWITVDTSAAEGLLALYTGVNIYLMAEEKTQPIELLLDNVNLTSLGKTEYVAVSADDWTTTTQGNATEYKLVSYTGTETYIQLIKEGGYENQFISVKTKLNGTSNVGLVLGARIPTATATSNSQAYNKEGFFLVLNNGFFTLYGPTYHGNHLGSFNYIPAPKADTEYELRFGVIWNNGAFKALFYIYNLDGTLHSSYQWTDLERGGNPALAREPKAGSFIVYSWYDKERSFTVSKPYDFIDAPALNVNGNTVSFEAPYADKFTISTDGGKTWTDNTTGRYVMNTVGAYDLQVRAHLGDTVSEATKKQCIYTVDDIELLNAKDISFSELSHDKGTITFANAGAFAGNSNSAALVLKKQYQEEFIKVSFKTPAGGTTTTSAGLHIGLKQSLATTVWWNAWNVSTTAVADGLYACNLAKAHYLDYSKHYNGSATTLYENPTTGAGKLTAETEYYYLVGVIGKGENAVLYCGLFKADGSPVVMHKWAWKDMQARAAKNNIDLPAIPDSGWFTIYNQNTTAQTISYEIIEDASTILAKYDYPTASYKGGVVSWSPVPWATAYEYTLDGGKSWTETDKTSVTLSSAGAYSFAVKAIKGETVSLASELSFVFVEDDIEILDAKNISFTTLNHRQGEITYAAEPNSNNWLASAITLKKQYTNEFIKVSFTATDTSVAKNGLEIGYRQQTASTVRHNAWGMLALEFGSCLVLNYSGNSVLDYCSKDVPGATGTPLCYDSSVNINTQLTVGAKYYYLAGVIGQGENATFYMGLYTEDDKPIRLFSFNWKDVYNRNNKAKPIENSGYFTIWNKCLETRTISYEIIDDVSQLLVNYEYPVITRNNTTISWNPIGWADGYKVSVNGGAYVAQTANTYTLNKHGLYNISVKAYKGTTESVAANASFIYSSTGIATGKMNISAYSEKENGEKTVTFTPDSTVTTTGHQSQSTASFAEATKYSDAFLKVGFKATASCLTDNYLNITIRSTYSTVPNPVFSGCYNFFVACFGATNMNIAPAVNTTNNQYTHWGSDHNSLTVGNDYYMIAGIKTNEDSTRTLYFLVTEKQADGTETLVKKMTWSFEAVSEKTGVAISNDGYFVVSSWLAGERTLTYQVLTGEAMNDYINM